MKSDPMHEVARMNFLNEQHAVEAVNHSIALYLIEPNHMDAQMILRYLGTRIHGDMGQALLAIAHEMLQGSTVTATQIDEQKSQE